MLFYLGLLNSWHNIFILYSYNGIKFTGDFQYCYQNSLLILQDPMLCKHALFTFYCNRTQGNAMVFHTGGQGGGNNSNAPEGQCN